MRGLTKKRQSQSRAIVRVRKNLEMRAHAIDGASRLLVILVFFTGIYPFFAFIVLPYMVSVDVYSARLLYGNTVKQIPRGLEDEANHLSIDSKGHATKRKRTVQSLPPFDW